MQEVYFDNSATTKVLDEVLSAINEVFKDNWANPSSIHKKGLAAEKLVEDSRATIARTLGVSKEEIYFTSSGSLASNLAILGSFEAAKKTRRHFVTTAVEHSATKNALAHLEKDEGYELTSLNLAIDGQDSLAKILAAVRDDTALLSIMQVNNELGTVFPVEEIAAAVKAKAPDCLIHVDAVQSYLKLPINLKHSKIDLMSISGHKVHAPKGIAALFIRKNTRIKPILFGGGQEGGISPGTENTAYIAGFAKAAQLLHGDIDVQYKKARTLNSYLKTELLKLSGVKILSPENGSPYILGASFLGIKSEILLRFLSAEGVSVSSGSACRKGSKSPVLQAFGFSDNDIDGFIRISLSRFSTMEEADIFLEKIVLAQKSIVRKDSKNFERNIPT